MVSHVFNLCFSVLLILKFHPVHVELHFFLFPGRKVVIGLPENNICAIEKSLRWYISYIIVTEN